MDYHLSVVQAFADYARGEIIADAEKIASALADNADKVVRILAHLSPAAPSQEG